MLFAVVGGCVGVGALACLNIWSLVASRLSLMAYKSNVWAGCLHVVDRCLLSVRIPVVVACMLLVDCPVPVYRQGRPFLRSVLPAFWSMVCQGLRLCAVVYDWLSLSPLPVCVIDAVGILFVVGLQCLCVARLAIVGAAR